MQVSYRKKRWYKIYFYLARDLDFQNPDCMCNYAEGAMHFYFDTSSGATKLPDAVGLAFTSVADARAHAMTLLPAMGVELPLTAGEYRSWTVLVRDDAGIVVCRLIMAIINDDLSPSSQRMLSSAP